MSYETDAPFLKAALAEAGYPNAFIIRDFDGEAAVRNNNPGDPPHDLIARAWSLLDESSDIASYDYPAGYQGVQ